ncbi:hypothetical protein HK105_205087 [Polyrhizophydium stewartii]|uniref:Ankyrin repeat protein n=1 Tax=Polyrhizophydium stewartii TaxID=2732419 RepID=A0ABR4N7H5_9FUNG|nr:hypothetical protein HK105_005773 [Polyrhizophydium stewartii]
MGRRHNTLWDKLPAPVRSYIIDRAGPLTRFTTGELPEHKLKSLSLGDQEWLWRDVVELEWPGDLRRLPQRGQFDPMVALQHVKSRAMYDRLKAHGRGRIAAALPFVAVLRRFDDDLDFSRPQMLAHMAAQYDGESMMRTLVADMRVVAPAADLASLAACYGSLGVLRVLHAHAPVGSWGSRAIDTAVLHGHADVLLWLHRNRPDERCSPDCDDAAAFNGHLDVIRCLHTHGIIQLTTNAVEASTINNHLHIVKWIHAQPELGHLFTQAAADKAVRAGLDMMQWYFNNGLAKFSRTALDYLVEFPQMPSLVWLLGNVRTVDWDYRTAIHIARQRNSSDAVELLTKHMFATRACRRPPLASMRII